MRRLAFLGGEGVHEIALTGQLLRIRQACLTAAQQTVDTSLPGVLVHVLSLRFNYLKLLHYQKFNFSTTNR